MSWYYKPYVSVAQRQANGRKQLEKMRKAERAIEPLGELSHRTKIATSFWGRAWCDHLESLGDYGNRLPRGRSYVRNGSVLHLSIETGKITALVQGAELYEQTILIEPLAAARWKRLKDRCRGGVGSFIELLQGKISDEIMGLVTDPADGIFPKLKEIKLDCSCPDWATLCKHLAAILYGVGAKLDQQPELLFKLRGVDHRELIDESAVATAIEGKADSKRRRTLAPSVLGDVFGIDLGGGPEALEREVASPEKTGASTGSAVPRKRSTKASATFQATADGVKNLRTALGLTQAEFAEWIGVSKQSVVNWERQRGALNLRATNLGNLEALHRGLSVE